jgi:hypothetical protein
MKIQITAQSCEENPDHSWHHHERKARSRRGPFVKARKTQNKAQPWEEDPDHGTVLRRGSRSWHSTVMKIQIKAQSCEAYLDHGT